jgi:hypothetical protein
MQALKKHSFVIPPELENIPTNTFETKHYDQIAFKLRKNKLQMGESKKNAGALSFYDSVFRGKGNDHKVYCRHMENKKLRDYHDKGKKKGKPRSPEEKKEYYKNEWRTYQMSDHLPMWVELKIDFSDEYLRGVRK